MNLQLGAIKLLWALVTGRRGTFGMLFDGGPYFVFGLITSIAVVLIVTVGLFFVIVPGIVAALATSFALYEVVVRDRGPIEAIQRSWKLTEGHKLELFAFGIVLALGGAVATVVTCGVGYLAVLPVVALAQAVMYQSLAGSTASEQTAPSS